MSKRWAVIFECDDNEFMAVVGRGPQVYLVDGYAARNAWATPNVPDMVMDLICMKVYSNGGNVWKLGNSIDEFESLNESNPVLTKILNKRLEEDK